MVLQHNLEALNANRNFKVATKRQEKSSEKLSSGYKINRAADNTAGLTISEGMRSMVRGLNRASNNSEDGLSLLQTADGALEEVHSILQRARELSVQAANDTNTDTDRQALQYEVDELLVEINRISDTTEFNTLKLLDGSIQGSGSNSAPYINNMMSAGPGIVHSGMENVNGAVRKDPIIDASAQGVCSAAELTNVQTSLDSMVPQATGAIMNALPAFNDLAVSDTIGVKLYADNSSTLAYVACSYSYDASGKISGLSLNLSVNVASLQFDQTSQQLTADSKRALETTVAHEMIHAFMDEVLPNGMLGATNGVVDKKNKFPGWFAEGMAQCAAGGCSNDNDWVNGGLGLHESMSESSIASVVQSSGNKLSSGTTASQYGTGYLACMYLGYLAAGGGNVDAGTIAGGLNTLVTKVKDGMSLSEAVKEISNGKYKSLGDFQKKFGDADSAHFIKLLLGAAGSTGNGSVLTGLGSANVLNPGVSNTSKYKPDFNREFAASTGTHTFRDGGSGGYGSGPALNLQVGSLGGQGVAISVDAMHTMALGLDGLSVLDYARASAAIEAIDYAINMVSENRSSIGAYMNRLGHTIANLDNTSENTQGAESRIRDTDMAEEMVEYSASNIISQAGQSMLAQANQGKHGILQLLQ